MPRTKAVDATLAEMGFTPVVVKARRVKNTNTVTVTRYNPETGSVNFKLGEEAASRYGESVDVYVNTNQHTIALVRTSGAPTERTAVIKKGGFTVATLGAAIPAEYLTKATYSLTWDDDLYSTFQLTVQEAAELVTA